jgi:hypothetical protein
MTEYERAVSAAVNAFGIDDADDRAAALDTLRHVGTLEVLPIWRVYAFDIDDTAIVVVQRVDTWEHVTHVASW